MTDTTPTRRGRPSTGAALSPAERQRRYRDRQKAKLAELTTNLSRDEKREALIDALNREGDALAIKNDRLTRELRAKERTIADLTKRVDQAEQDLARLRASVATWRLPDGSESATEPPRPKKPRRKAVT